MVVRAGKHAYKIVIRACDGQSESSGRSTRADNYQTQDVSIRSTLARLGMPREDALTTSRAHAY